MAQPSSLIKSESTPTRAEIEAEIKAWSHIKTYAEARIDNCQKALKALEQVKTTPAPLKPDDPLEVIRQQVLARKQGKK